MAIDPIYLLYGAIFLSALLLIEGLYYLIVDQMLAKRRANRRLSLLHSGMEGREVLELLRRQPKTGDIGFGFLSPVVAGFQTLITQSGIAIQPSRAALLMAGLTASLFFGLQVMATLGHASDILRPVSVQACLSFLGGIGLPLFVFSRARSKRKRKFAQQLPDALDILVRSLRAGHPINAALGLVAKEMSDPMGTEFGIVVDEVTYGLDMREALTNLGDRVQVDDFNYVVVSINIQHETGGNLAEVLDNLSSVIRARARMFLKVRALSSEGRMSALVLCALPFFTAGSVLLLSPTYFSEVTDDPLFLPILGGAVLNLLLGIVVIHRMVNFRV